MLLQKTHYVVEVVEVDTTLPSASSCVSIITFEEEEEELPILEKETNT